MLYDGSWCKAEELNNKEIMCGIEYPKDIKYNDEMWYIWCIIKDYSEGSSLFNRIDYAKFCILCYENSAKY
jgi:hypothetical protein